MGGRIPVSEARTEMPTGMNEVSLGVETAREINWVK
jgi:hypothetical protein